jgi:hypothetical protein
VIPVRDDFLKSPSHSIQNMQELFDRIVIGLNTTRASTLFQDGPFKDCCNWTPINHGKCVFGFEQSSSTRSREKNVEIEEANHDDRE